MTSLLVRIVIVAVALLLAALLVPDIEVTWSDEAAGTLLSLGVLAFVFGLVNAVIRPVARVASIPLNIATLGLFSVLLNAALLLLVAFIVDLAWEPLITIGGYPPDLGLEAIAAAALGSFIISAVSTALTVLIPDA